MTRSTLWNYGARSQSTSHMAGTKITGCLKAAFLSVLDVESYVGLARQAQLEQGNG